MLSKVLLFSVILGAMAATILAQNCTCEERLSEMKMFYRTMIDSVISTMHSMNNNQGSAFGGGAV